MLSRFKRTKFQDSIARANKTQTITAGKKYKKKLLIEASEDEYYFSIFGSIVKKLSSLGKLESEIYISRNFSVGESKNVFKFILYRLSLRVLTLKYERLYKELCSHGIGFRCSCTLNSFKSILNLWAALKIWRKINSKKELLALRIGGVDIGDLIYDTYLRFKPAPTVDVKNWYLLFILWNSIDLIDASKRYFRDSNVGVYLTSYATYISNGIPARVALLYGVNVFTFGNLQEFAKQLSEDDWFQTRNCDNYLSDFLTLPNREKLKDEAMKRMDERTSGIIDTSILYMKSSPYQKSSNENLSVSNASVIFLHDFFDSPHIYPWLLFPDFWEWIVHTTNILEKNNLAYFVKPHPNSVPDNIAILEKLKSRIGKNLILDKKISNLELINGGINCAITGYGTIASEMGFLGIPTITCGYNPHLNFSFCKTPSTIEEYDNLLIANKENLINIEIARQEAAIFYYMHNLGSHPDEVHTNKLAVELRYKSERSDESSFIELLEGIENSKGFEAFNMKISNKLTMEIV